MATSEQHIDFGEILKSRGLKLTKTRKSVLEILAGSAGAVSYAALQEQLGEADRVTIYRTVQSLLDKAVIHTAYKDGNDTYLALCEDECSSESHHHFHIHFKCLKCEVVSCVDMPSEIKVEIPGYTIEQFNVEASGICEACH